MAKKVSKSETKPVGRPSKYKPDYCNEVVLHMEQGFSFDSFAGRIGVSRDTLYEWLKVYPEFSDKVAIAQAKCLLKWEQLGLAGMLGKVKGFNGGVYAFNMTNRFRWTTQPKPDVPPEQKEAENALNEALALLDSKK